MIDIYEFTTNESIQETLAFTAFDMKLISKEMQGFNFPFYSFICCMRLIKFSLSIL